jgi:2-polyprenyl-6-methoxyphenol hydroxylase-like FAD-dependent oxidoreductase
VAERIRQASPLPQDFPRNVIFATRLKGYELALFDNAFYGGRIRDDRFNEPAEWIPQYVVEAVLRDQLRTLASAEVRFGTRFENALQTANGVLAEVTDLRTGKRERLGAASRVRQEIGARMEGKHAYARNFSVVMRAPQLTALNPQTKALMYWLVNSDAPGIIAPLDHGDRWTFGLPLAPDQAQPDEEEIRHKIVHAVGCEFDFEIEVTDAWAAHSLLATSYRSGRIFLAGDACHLHPPMGGYGMNMGIGDSVDLGWKLGAVLRGWGGAGLLESYERERRPVHQFVIDEAVTNYSVLTDSFLRDNLERVGPEGDEARGVVGREILKTKVREFKTLGVVLGCNYSGSPLTIADGTSPPDAHFGNYRPSAHPGCLAPHAWLANGSSLYDHFGQGFALLVLGTEDDDAGQIATAATRHGVPLTVVRPQDANLQDLYDARYALIRPDQHVAWRARRAPSDIDAVIRRITGFQPAAVDAAPA